MAVRIIEGILTGTIDDVGVTVVLMSEVPKQLPSKYCLNMAYFRLDNAKYDAAS